MVFLGNGKFEPLNVLFPHYPSFSIMIMGWADLKPKLSQNRAEPEQS
jgi:hypothetical protein